MLFRDIHQLIIYSYLPHIEFVRTSPTLREGYHMAFGVKKSKSNRLITRVPRGHNRTITEQYRYCLFWCSRFSCFVHDLICLPVEAEGIEPTRANGM